MSKPLSEMTDEEVLAEITRLRERRLQRKEEQITAKIKIAKEKKPSVSKVKKDNEVDSITEALLRNILGGENNE